ncbi:hypothetical protein HBN50_13910 [Halobacteriovorax sp. GB3]|uniref:hypothetical protein n=1 Tax=Halobacteriovorax sp. GB3 TaxID=2719615 RepID=UPI0023612A2D|nr:hypothetical protein [Halobacteriovorax sp. GB3]MDD0854203.1 hypothetical protein [Halobacteriovorax sp. GB3]
MFFGEYLLSKNIISRGQLLEVLADQENSTKSVFEIIQGESFFEKMNLSKAIHIMYEKKISFLNACLDADVLAQNECESVIMKMQESRPNFIEILVEKSILSAEDINKHYEEFLNAGDIQSSKPESSISAESDEVEISDAALESLRELGIDDSSLKAEVSVASASSVNEETSDEGEIEISAAALESLKEIGGVSSDILNELESSAGASTTESDNSSSNSTEIEGFVSQYLDTFTDKTYKKMSKVVGMIYSTAESGSDVANIMNSLYRELHITKGAACLADLKISEKLLDVTEELLEKLFKLPNNELIKWVKDNLTCLEDCIDILWDLRGAIHSAGNELEFWSIEEQKIRYTNNIKKIKNLLNG